jgi:hypothetical protein
MVLGYAAANASTIDRGKSARRWPLLHAPHLPRLRLDCLHGYLARKEDRF